MGRYFSSISNEANLKNQQFGWLIFGVREKDRKVVGTNKDMATLEKLKHEISVNTTGISFLDIYEVYPVVDEQQKRVIMFKIPAAITAMPTGWKNRYYGRAGDSLGFYLKMRLILFVDSSIRIGLNKLSPIAILFTWILRQFRLPEKNTKGKNKIILSAVRLMRCLILNS